MSGGVPDLCLGFVGLKPGLNAFKKNNGGPKQNRAWKVTAAPHPELQCWTWHDVETSYSKMDSGTVWAHSHSKPLLCCVKTAAMLGCAVPAFSLPRGRLQGPQPHWKTRGTQQSTLKWLVLVHTDLLPSRGCQGASVMQKQGDQGLRETINKNNCIFNSLSYKEEERKHTVWLTGST